MDIAMPYVRIKQKYQVTIPASIRKNLKLHEGDTLEVKEEGGNLILTPQTVTRREPEHIPNAETIAAMNEDLTSAKIFSSVEELMADLDS